MYELEVYFVIEIAESELSSYRLARVQPAGSKLE